MHKISDNFARDEFITSGVASRMGYAICLDRYVLENLERLVTTVLQPARTALDRPFVITSGYRPPWLNRAVHGEKDSRHLYGCAADFKIPGMDLVRAFNKIRDLGLPVDQLILEDPPAGWIHAGIALPGEAPRGDYLVANRTPDGRMSYERV